MPAASVKNELQKYVHTVNLRFWYLYQIASTVSEIMYKISKLTFKKKIIKNMFGSEESLSDDDESCNQYQGPGLALRPANAGVNSFHPGTEESLFIHVENEINRHQGEFIEKQVFCINDLCCRKKKISRFS